MICINCGSLAQVAMCTDYNPIFNCYYSQGEERRKHVHYFCTNSIWCGYSWIQFTENPKIDSKVVQILSTR